jgi:GAF domain-containing protein
MTADSEAKERAYAEIFRDLLPRLDAAASWPEAGAMVVEALSRLPHFDWTGIYELSEPGTLVLGPFRGEPTEHVRIPVGRGVCGQSAARDATIVVDDVRAEANYLACSVKTRSEIVIPVRAKGVYRAQIDVDSHRPAAFDDLDRRRLEALAERLGARLAALEEETA